jgi:hypothetical protein
MTWWQTICAVAGLYVLVRWLHGELEETRALLRQILGRLEGAEKGGGKPV